MTFGAAALAALAALAVSAVAAARPAARVGTAGVTVRLPAGWHAWVPPGVPTSGVTDPRTRVVAVSAPFSFGATGCQVAAYAFPSTAVAVVVVEWVSLGRDDRWLPRPARFTAANLPLHQPPAIDCFAGPGGSIEFAERGRRLGAYLLAGRRASPQLVARARAVLDTLRAAGR